MSTLSRWIVLSACAPLILSGCGGDPVGPRLLETPPGPVEVTIAVDPSEAYETCREIRVQAKATSGKHPVRGLVVNFVPLSGSVFAAAVATNKDGVATTYWKLGRVFETSTLLARAVDEDGTRVLDDTLTLEKRQRPTRLDDYGMQPYSPELLPYGPPMPPPGIIRFMSRARLVDGCGDPIPDALLQARFSGPGIPTEAVEQTVRTINFNFPERDYWGMGVVFYHFTSVPPGSYQVTWHAVDAPELMVTNYWIWH